METSFPDFKSSRLLVHIAFHFVEKRIQYVEKVIETIQTYPFSEIDIVVDTNTLEASEKIGVTSHSPHVKLLYAVHENLLHPYLLTWQHRRNMKESINSNDYFMYLEDDILVPPETLERWRVESEMLYPFNYTRGFLRVETNNKGETVCTDQYLPAKTKNLVRLQGSLFYSLHVPYQGFWVYSRRQMVDFMKLPAWKYDGSDWCIRERAASGMILLDKKKLKRNRTLYNVLIPVSEPDKIPKDAMVYHLPNTYANHPKAKCGKLLVDKLVKPGPVEKLLQRLTPGNLQAR